MESNLHGKGSFRYDAVNRLKIEKINRCDFCQLRATDEYLQGATKILRVELRVRIYRL